MKKLNKIKIVTRLNFRQKPIEYATTGFTPFAPFHRYGTANTVSSKSRLDDCVDDAVKLAKTFQAAD